MKKYLLIFLLTIVGRSYALKPSATYTYTPDSFGVSSQSFKIQCTEEISLNAWKIEPLGETNRNTTLIIAGADAGNMSAYSYHAAMLAKSGYTVLTFDYRGFGESSHFPIDERFLYYNEFADDLAAVIQWSKANIKTNKLGILAYSMGTIITAKAIQENSIDFLIMEGMVYNPFVISIRLKLNRNKEVLIPEQAEQIVTFYENISCKMLVFAGTLDQITTLADSKTYCSKRKKRKLVKFKGNHMQGMEFFTKKSYGDLYIKLIEKFT